jgi:hypothetical protein
VGRRIAGAVANAIVRWLTEGNPVAGSGHLHAEYWADRKVKVVGGYAANAGTSSPYLHAK